MRRIFCSKAFWTVLISIEAHAIVLVLFMLVAKADRQNPENAESAATPHNARATRESLPGLSEQSTFACKLSCPSFSTSFRIDSEDYFKYRFGGSHRPQGTHARDYAAFATPNDTYIMALARVIRMTVMQEKQVAAIVRLVQGITYEYDRKVNGKAADFVRYPLETVIEGCGDCEDTALLAASLLAAAGREVVLVKASPTQKSVQSAIRQGTKMPAGHVLIGIPGTKGKTIKRQGKRYTLVETTGIVPIGDVPSSWDGLDWAKATVAPVKSLHPASPAKKRSTR